jgi:hypothetical protein
MDNDHIQPSPFVKPPERLTATGASRQPVTGLTPPQRAEALVREVRPSVAAIPAISGPARRLIQTVFLAPLGWLMLAPLFPLKFHPFICKRYTLTNRRLMVRRGLARPRPIQEVALADIDDVRVDPASRDDFYHAGTLEVLSQGKTVLRMPGVPQPEAFRHAILNAARAWVPGKKAGVFIPASAKTP